MRRFYAFRTFLFLRRETTIKPNATKEHFINEEIVSDGGLTWETEVRVVSDGAGQVGILTLRSALDTAYDSDLDLVLMAADANPPVVRIMDYGKFIFDRDKREKEARKKQQKVEVKEVQLSCRIDVGDFNTKANQTRKFLQEGNKVRVNIRFKGRQMTHIDIGQEIMDKFIEAVSEFGEVDKKPVLDGRNMSMLIVPIKK